MNLKERIDKDFMVAFKAKAMGKKTFLGLIKGEIQLNVGRGIEATDENVLKVLTKMKKSAEAIMEANPKATAYLEIDWLDSYMPTLMSEFEINRALDHYLEDGGVSNMGAIMGYFNKHFKGKVDNSVLSRLVKDELS